MSDTLTKESEIIISEQDFNNIEMNILPDKNEVAIDIKDHKNVNEDVNDDVNKDVNDDVNEDVNDDVNKDVIDDVNEDVIDDVNKEVTEKNPIEESYNIPNSKKITYLKSKLIKIRDKQLIYEYHYEGINQYYNSLSLCIVILSTLLTTIEAGQFADFSAVKPLEYTLKGLAVALGLTITLLSSVIKFRQYKEKVESIGKYMDQLDILADDIEYIIKKIELSNVSDQDFYNTLQHISIIVTRTNSKLFNITSKQFYYYYKKLKLLDYNKWEIYYDIKTKQESSYNVFLEKRLESQNKRLDLEQELREIGKKINDDPQLSNRFKRDIFKYPDTVKET